MLQITKNEINEFNPSYQNQMKIRSNTLYNSSLLSNITLLSPVMSNDMCIIFNEKGDVETLDLVFIMRNYLSLLSPAWTMEKILSHPEIVFGTSFSNKYISPPVYFICHKEEGGFNFLDCRKKNGEKFINGYDKHTNITSLDFKFLRPDGSEILPQED